MSWLLVAVGGALGSRSMRRVVDEPRPYEPGIATEEHVVPTRFTP